ncbi:MAG: hypothetical protein NTZ25_00480 [Candidatus Peregrinibacteria bacterium]|nr:hypothetical protein [Candidatus Peregrinibacteria bacterium]
MADDQTKVQELGPGRISFGTFLLKILAGAAGGIGGSLILVIIFVLASSIMTPLTGGSQDGTPIQVSPIFTFILMMMIFLSTTVGNIISTWLMALTERGKYTRTSSAISQVFIISMIIFILMVPVYFITAATNVTITAYAVALHIIIAAQVSALILEIVSNYRYALVGVYGITFSILVSAGIMFGLAGIVSSPQILLFVALPIVWGSIAFVQSIFTMLYGWIARTYDKDFLSTQTVYGNDYGKEVEAEEEPEAPKAKDEEGANFLRHN